MDRPERMVFIVGTGRSGTNLLQAMLNGHPSIRIGTETHFIPTCIRKFGKEKVDVHTFCEVIADHWTSDGKRRWIDFHLEEGGRSKERFRKDFARFYAPKERGTVSQLVNAFLRFCYGSWAVLGDKTPQYGLHMKEIHEHWPEAKFIHMVRDGRYAAGSMQKHEGFLRLINAGYPEDIREYSYKRRLSEFKPDSVPLEKCAVYWEKIIKKIRSESKRVPSSSYIEVKCEELIESPVYELVRVGRFVGVDSMKIQYIARSCLPYPFKVIEDKNSLKKARFTQLTNICEDALSLFGYSVDYHNSIETKLAKRLKAYMRWVILYIPYSLYTNKPQYA